MYFIDDEKIYNELEDKEEQFIYSCIYTRSCDGYVRQRHMRKIMENDFPQWCMPYILKLSSEYVVEIVDDIYKYMKVRDNTSFQLFCKNNPHIFRNSYSRMVSYWNEFYRCRCYKFHNYVGYRLYKDKIFKKPGEKNLNNFSMIFFFYKVNFKMQMQIKKKSTEKH